MKLGHLTLLTWFYPQEQFYINRLKTLRMGCKWLKLEFKKGYKTPLRRSGHKYKAREDN